VDDQKVTEIRERLLSVANHAMIARDRVGRLDYDSVGLEGVCSELGVVHDTMDEIWWSILREDT